MRRVWILLTGMAFLGVAIEGFAAPNKMHPTFSVLDAAGESVLRSGLPASSDTTCGACHDTAWIDRHNVHVSDHVRATCVDCHLEGGRLPSDPASFDAEGRLRREALLIHAPRDENCARCHGFIHVAPEPLMLPSDFESAPSPDEPSRSYDLTRRTGVIVSAQDRSESYLNLAGKAGLDLPWDVHARRGVTCTACHFAPNNPARAHLRDSGLAILAADPRRLPTSEYLRRPDHRLAVATCTACHDPLKAHDFLPYRKRHLAVLSCQACHVPRLTGPAVMAEDATVVSATRGPVVSYRGVTGPEERALGSRLIEGYVPFLLAAPGADHGPRLAPFNLVTRWEWTSSGNGRPVPWTDVVNAWFEGDRVAPGILRQLDDNGDGVLARGELALSTAEDVEAVRARLQAAGVADPVIRASVTAYPVNHGVVSGARVRRDCDDCHAPGGRFEQPLLLASSAPGGVLPLLDASGGPLVGAAALDDDGQVVLQRDQSACHVFVFGVTCAAWPAQVGFALFAAVVLGIALHAALRYRARGRHAAPHGKVERLYLYPAYERFWHWVMAFSVIVLLVTGFEVHGRGYLSLFGMPLAVRLHDVFAVVLIANAFLSLFYHVASAAIRQFFPPRENLQAEMAAQARYYLRGIFLGQPHPVPKSITRKLNPLQQVTYLGLLNILFPFQVVSGALMWGVSEWPDLAASVGGLTIVAPLHHLGAWLFLAFFVLHVYLTTTGRTLTSNLAAMVHGWEEVEVLHPGTQEGGSHAR